MEKTSIFFFCEESEKELAKDISKRLGLSLSAFCRMAIINRLNQEKIILQQIQNKQNEVSQ